MSLPLETNYCLLNKMMRRAFLKKLGFWMLSMTAVFAETDFQVHGRFNYDLASQTSQKNSLDENVADSLRTSPSHQIGLMHLNFKYFVKEKIALSMRLGKDLDYSENFWDDRLFYPQNLSPIAFLSAYVDFAFNKHIDLKTGLIPLQDLNMTLNNPRSILIDQTLNQIYSDNSSKFGISLSASWHPISLQGALWNQTNTQPISKISGTSFNNLNSFSQLNTSWVNALIEPSDYHSRTLKLGYSAALAFVPSEYDEIGSAFTASFLFSPLNQPYLIATLGSTGSSTSVGLSLYDAFSAYHGNYLAYWRNIALDLGIEYDRIHLQDFNLVGDSSYAESNVFQSDPVAVAYNAILSYTFAQAGDYKIDRHSGHFSQKPLGLTLGCGLGAKTQKNLFAFLSQIGQSDWVSSSYTDISGANRLDLQSWTDENYLDRSYQLIAVDNAIPQGGSLPYATNIDPQGNEQHAFQIHSRSVTFIANYQFNEFMEWKNELSYIRHQKMILGEDYTNQTQSQAAYASSIYWKNSATLRSQLSVSF